MFNRQMFAAGALALLLASCRPAATAELPIRPIDRAIQQAVAYLEAEHARGSFGLLPESPDARPHKHWLANDNQLVVYALRAAHQESFAAQLEQEIQKWNAPQHGIIEALVGKRITWPPHPELKYVIGPDPSQQTFSAPNVCSELSDAPQQVICHETRNPEKDKFDDWAEYTDLALYGALEACNRGDVAMARTYYQQAMEQFDGVGFADKAYTEGLYATYKLALALYVGTRLGEPHDDRVLSALLAQQYSPSEDMPDRNWDGGFIALYNSHGVSQGDSNTETTAYALLALATLREASAGQAPSPACPKE